MEADEERLSRADELHPALNEELEHDNNTDWLRSSGWSRWFRQKPISIVVASAGSPTTRYARNIFLRRWNAASTPSLSLVVLSEILLWPGVRAAAIVEVSYQR